MDITDFEDLENLREKLAELEHDQWQMWSKNLWSELNSLRIAIENKNEKRSETIITRRINRWRVNWKSYSLLDKKAKDQDRIWANKVMDLLEKEGFL